MKSSKSLISRKKIFFQKNHPLKVHSNLNLNLMSLKRESKILNMHLGMAKKKDIWHN